MGFWFPLPCGLGLLTSGPWPFIRVSSLGPAQSRCGTSHERDSSTFLGDLQGLRAPDNVYFFLLLPPKKASITTWLWAQG